MSGSKVDRTLSDEIYEMLASPFPPGPDKVCELMSATARYIDRLSDALFFALDSMDLDAMTQDRADLIIHCCDLGVGPYGASVDEVMSE